MPQLISGSSVLANDCVSLPSRAAAVVNPMYVYGKVFELGEKFKDTLAMQPLWHKSKSPGTELS
jgi:hypothetical protein